jgi:hypothetical protein
MFQKWQELAELTRKAETMTEEEFEATLPKFNFVANAVGLSELNVSIIAGQLASGLLKTEEDVKLAVEDYK